MKIILIVIAVLTFLVGAKSILADPVTEIKTPETAPQLEKSPSWLIEVRIILAVRNDTRAALEQEFLEATNENRALEIQRQIQELEETTELQIMNAQLDHLKQSGHFEEATSLAASINEMTDPQPLRAPEPREESVGR